ncbi:MAG: hypothetical protein R2794_13140 [Chitinophagales bacterium]
MKKKLLYITFCLIALVPFCTGTKKVQTVNVEPAVSWQKDVFPILADRCTPCHFPETGKKKLLNTYEASAESIDDIIMRIQLAQDAPGFMPFKNKKEPLSDSLIHVFVLWKEQGLLP